MILACTYLEQHCVGEGKYRSADLEFSDLTECATHIRLVAQMKPL